MKYTKKSLGESQAQGSLVGLGSDTSPSGSPGPGPAQLRTQPFRAWTRALETHPCPRWRTGVQSSLLPTASERKLPQRLSEQLLCRADSYPEHDSAVNTNHSHPRRAHGLTKEREAAQGSLHMPLRKRTELCVSMQSAWSQDCGCPWGAGQFK